MTLNTWMAYAGALLCGGLAVWALWREPRSFVYRVFGVGMLVLASRAVFMGLSSQAIWPAEVMRWQQFAFVATALLPGIWLLFSLSYARADSRPELGDWKWPVLAIFMVPLTLATAFGYALFNVPRLATEAPGWLLPLDWSGYVLSLVLLPSSLLVLMQLEQTLRASTGGKRWQIKFMVLGVGSVFAAQIYTCSQTLLFSAVDPHTEAINGYATAVAALLIMVSLRRGHMPLANLYLSPVALYNSLTVLVVGIYLLMVGFMAEAVIHFGGTQLLPLAALAVFLALVGLTIVLLSDQLRQECKRFINRHFYRARYDYRREWTRFTQSTASVVEVRELCAVVVKMVSETFGTPAVAIWLQDEVTPQHVTMGASTVLLDTQRDDTKQRMSKLSEVLHGRSLPVEVSTLAELSPALPCLADLRYGVALQAGQQRLGVMTLGERQTNEPFVVEDLDLLKTIADQTAASLLNLQLSQQLSRARQMEAFQALSAFFVHDIKNLAAKLSLTMQNMQIHFDNPAFRDHALKVLSSSVEKMHDMCSRLAMVGKELELHRTEIDLNQLVRAILADLHGALHAALHQELNAVPRLQGDPEQLQKVLLNLVLNANEAVNGDGEIRVTTEHRERWAILSVSDNGCGMSEEFIAQSLFRPFRTTKGKGLGIGLYHSKMIAEAHQGRLKVESQEGKGSTFRLFLPVASAG